MSDVTSSLVDPPETRTEALEGRAARAEALVQQDARRPVVGVGVQGGREACVGALPLRRGGNPLEPPAGGGLAKTSPGVRAARVNRNRQVLEVGVSES